MGYKPENKKSLTSNYLEIAQDRFLEKPFSGMTSIEIIPQNPDLSPILLAALLLSGKAQVNVLSRVKKEFLFFLLTNSFDMNIIE